MKKAVILFSGGLDSTTVLAFAKNNDYDCYPISFNYNQRHASELHAARRIARHYGIENHKIVTFPKDMLGASALTDNNIDVPSGTEDNIIPVTYVPARNTIFLSIALGYAESIGARDIFLGISHIDYSNYPDCRPEYIEAFSKMANLATKDGVSGNTILFHTPLLHLSKAETIKMGIANGVDYAMTVSCYKADESNGAACGICASCSFRKKGFEEAGVMDPTLYQTLDS